MTHNDWTGQSYCCRQGATISFLRRRGCPLLTDVPGTLQDSDIWLRIAQVVEYVGNIHNHADILIADLLLQLLSCHGKSYYQSTRPRHSFAFHQEKNAELRVGMWLELPQHNLNLNPHHRRWAWAIGQSLPHYRPATSPTLCRWTDTPVEQGQSQRPPRHLCEYSYNHIGPWHLIHLRFYITAGR